MKKSLENFIKKFVREYPKNENTISRWDEPLICYASTTDPKFVYTDDENIKNWCKILPSANTIITYFIPFSDHIVETNSKGAFASKEWVFANIETIRLLNKLSIAIRDRLLKKGYHSIILHDDDIMNKYADIMFSLQYIGYVSGLGTFGMNNTLITEKGCSGISGAIITELKIEPTKMLETELCLQKNNEVCNDCITACPVSAIATDKFDDKSCSDYLQRNNQIYSSLGDCMVCGKCISNVRCSKIK